MSGPEPVCFGVKKNRETTLVLERSYGVNEEEDSTTLKEETKQLCALVRSIGQMKK
jgi:hypothetical protein